MDIKSRDFEVDQGKIKRDQLPDYKAIAYVASSIYFLYETADETMTEASLLFSDFIKREENVFVNSGEFDLYIFQEVYGTGPLMETESFDEVDFDEAYYRIVDTTELAERRCLFWFFCSMVGFPHPEQKEKLLNLARGLNLEIEPENLEPDKFRDKLEVREMKLDFLERKQRFNRDIPTHYREKFLNSYPRHAFNSPAVFEEAEDKLRHLYQALVLIREKPELSGEQAGEDYVVVEPQKACLGCLTSIVAIVVLVHLLPILAAAGVVGFGIIFLLAILSLPFVLIFSVLSR